MENLKTLCTVNQNSLRIKFNLKKTKKNERAWMTQAKKHSVLLKLKNFETAWNNSSVFY